MEDGGVHDLLENILQDVCVDRDSETFAIITFLELLLGEEVCKSSKSLKLSCSSLRWGKLSGMS